MRICMFKFGRMYKKHTSRITIPRGDIFPRNGVTLQPRFNDMLSTSYAISLNSKFWRMAITLVGKLIGISPRFVLLFMNSTFGTNRGILSPKDT